MQVVLHEIAEHNLQKRTIALIENGTWTPATVNLMTEALSKLKNNTVLDKKVTIKSALDKDSFADLQTLADDIAVSLN